MYANFSNNGAIMNIKMITLKRKIVSEHTCRCSCSRTSSCWFLSASAQLPLRGSPPLCCSRFLKRVRRWFPPAWFRNPPTTRRTHRCVGTTAHRQSRNLPCSAGSRAVLSGGRREGGWRTSCCAHRWTACRQLAFEEGVTSRSGN